MDEGDTLEECSHATKEVLQLLHPSPNSSHQHSHPVLESGPPSARGECVPDTEGYALSEMSSFLPAGQSEMPHCSTGQSEIPHSSTEFAPPAAGKNGASSCSAGATVDHTSVHSSSSSNGSFTGLSTHSATPHMSRGSTVALTSDPRSLEPCGVPGAYTPCTGPPSHGSSPVPTMQIDLASHGQPVGLGNGAYDVSRQVSCVTFHSHCVTTPSGSSPNRIFSCRIPSEVELLREVSVQFQAAAACNGATSPSVGAGPPPPPVGSFASKVLVHPGSPSGERIKSATFPTPAQQSYDLRHSSSRPCSPRAPAEPQALPPQDRGMSNGRRKSGGHYSPTLPIQQPSRLNLATSSVQVAPPLDGLRSPGVPVGPAGSFSLMQQQQRVPHMLAGATGTNGTASPTVALLVAPPPRSMHTLQALHNALQPSLGQGPGMSTPRMLPTVQAANGQMAQSMSMVMRGPSQGLQPTASAPRLMSVPGSPRVPEHRPVLGHVAVMQHGGHASTTLSPATAPPFRQNLLDEQAPGSGVAMHGATGQVHRWSGPSSSVASRETEACMCPGLASM